MNFNETNLEALWAEYQLTGSDSARNAIAERFVPLVHLIANRMSDRLPKSVEADDLVGWGAIGLMRAVETYRPNLGTKFSTWAAYKVRSAILDEMREQSPVPRSLQTRINNVDRFRTLVRTRHGRGASEQEVYEAFGGRVAKIVDNAEGIRADRSAVDPETGEPLMAVDAIRDFREVDASTRAEAREMMAIAVNRLMLTEALLIHYYFFEGWTMRQIGRELICKAESRVSQLMKSSLRKLRNAA